MSSPSTDKQALPTLRLTPAPAEVAPQLPRSAIEASTQLDTYKLAHVETASPERLLVMLYEGALRFLNIAIQALQENQLETAHNNILKAEAIILELMSVLDMDLGGEIARNLYNLYDFLYRHLVKANISHEYALLQEVVNILEDLRGAWDEAATIVTQLRANGQFDLSQPGGLSFAG